ncbi:putative periplasmic serine endoprotease DegP-like [Stylophora pistillata]|uniref:Serine protease n=1 Tax=Stylophora pistillata TaxID=50429 RepID=A0A2B4SNP9_STYPI|nr:putative periplasmic serine endoprotease DegP-like [Stylophora pistillata]
MTATIVLRTNLANFKTRSLVIPAKVFSTISDTGFRNVDNSDLLGNEGRKVLDACVKVKIYGKPEIRSYDLKTTISRFDDCYLDQEELLTAQLQLHDWPFSSSDDASTHNIVDIHNALDKIDNMPYVEKYPKQGPSSEEIGKLIDKRRADVEREWREAKADPDRRQKYSWAVAQRRVRDCYAGSFPCRFKLANGLKEANSIKEIYESLVDLDERSQYTCSYQAEERSQYEEISEFRADIESKYYEAVASTGPLHRYTITEANIILNKCYHCLDLFSRKGFYGCNICGIAPSVCIFQIHDALFHCDMKMQKLYKYTEQGPGSVELNRSIDAYRDKLKEEYENFLKGDESRPPACKYSRCEVERLLRYCFAGASPNDVDLFPVKQDESGMPRIYQTFDIFDIKTSLDYFDSKKIVEKYPEKGHVSDEMKRKIEECRASIDSEYKEATAIKEIEHGSGFIIQDHFVLTNKHVIQTYLDDEDSYEIRFSNESIGELSCKVAHHDQCKDLALLYCPDRNLHISEICPLQLSTQPLLPGKQIFSFGYPMSHTGKTALFVTGNVSGCKETYSGPSYTVLNCSLNHGNSGGPVLAWVDGQVRVVGIATQKHFKNILTLEERMAVENLRKSLQAKAISDVEEGDVVALSRHVLGQEIPRSCHVSLHLLTLKLYDALETHSQFNLSNALPGHLVVEFIKNFNTKYKGEHKQELVKVIELSQ